MCGRRPGCSLRQKDRGRRFYQRKGSSMLRPRHPELTPTLQTRVAAAHGCQLLTGPLVRSHHSGRTGKPRPDLVKESARIVHDVGVIETLVADARVHIQIQDFRCRRRRRGWSPLPWPVLRRCECRQGQHDHQGEQTIPENHADHHSVQIASPREEMVVSLAFVS